MTTLPLPADESVPLSGKIKWFNRSKGFGFVVPEDGSSDIFLPLAVLERAGFAEAPEGASVTVGWAVGPKGRAATQLLSLDTSTALPRAAREEDGVGKPTQPLDGVVKWYDVARGFGFILPNDGGKDIFVHITVLRRCGLEELQPGQPVRMSVAEARRGREAASLELLPPPG